MKKGLLIPIAIIIALAAGSQIDDGLRDEALVFVDKLEKKRESESYTYLIGIYASENDDPANVGLHLLGEYRKAELDEAYTIAEYPESNVLPLPGGELFCSTWEENCLETIFSTDFNINALRKENHILLKRTEIFHKFNEYQTLTKPLINERIPPYHYIVVAERINLLTAISQYKSGNSEYAINSLQTQLKYLRRMMALQDNLIGKLIYLAKLSEIVDTASIILSDDKNQIRADMIPALTPAEKDFDMVATREFGLSYYSLMNLDKHLELLEISGNFPDWASRTFFKPNMTINALTPIYLRFNRLSKMTPAEFAVEVEHEVNIDITTSRIRNYAGSVVIEDLPNFDQYVVRFMDFDAKLALFNHMFHLRGDTGEAENPYYKGQYSDVSDNSVCFSGPLEDKRQLRCLPTQI